MTLKKLLPFIPAASIFFILILAFAVPIQAAGNIDYLDANGALKTSPAAIDYTGQTSMGTINTTTWYVVTDVQAPEDRIIIAGNVNLILTDSSYLNASRGGIEVQGTNSLTIYAQSVGTGRGRLAAHGTPNSSGIGGSDGNDGGTITITGGTISAFGDEFGAGIGGGLGGNGATLTISNGNVTASSIGGGAAKDVNQKPSNGGTTTITGGNVTVWENALGDPPIYNISGGTFKNNAATSENAPQNPPTDNSTAFENVPPNVPEKSPASNISDSIVNNPALAGLIGFVILAFVFITLFFVSKKSLKMPHFIRFRSNSSSFDKQHENLSGMESTANIFLNGIKTAEKNLKLFVPPLIFGVLMTIGFFIFVVLMAIRSFGTIAGFFFVGTAGEILLNLAYLLLFAFIVYFIAGYIGMIKEALSTGKTGYNHFWRYGKQFFWRLFVINIIGFLILSVSLIFWMPSYLRSGYLNFSSPAILITPAPALVGLILTLIYGTIVFFLFFFVNYSAVVDNFSVIDSYKKSVSLLKEKTYQMVKFIVLYLIITSILAITIVFSLIMFCLALLSTYVVYLDLTSSLQSIDEFAILGLTVWSILLSLFSAAIPMTFSIVWVTRFYMLITGKPLYDGNKIEN